jgi:hypothetical protein
LDQRLSQVFFVESILIRAMPPTKSKNAKRAPTKKVKRSKKCHSRKSKPKRKSTFRNKKLKRALPKIPRLTPQERAQGLSRIQKGEYQEGIHQPYIRSGKEIIVNPSYLNSAAYLSGGVPINAEIEIDEMMDTSGDYRPGYEPEPDAKRMSSALREKYEAEGITPKQRAEVEKKKREEKAAEVLAIAQRGQAASNDRVEALRAAMQGGFAFVTEDGLREAASSMSMGSYDREGIVVALSNGEIPEDEGLNNALEQWEQALDAEYDFILELADELNINREVITNIIDDIGE